MMTREEATEILRKRQRYCKVIANHANATVKADELREIEAIDIAITALRPVSREQVEKVWRGEWEWYDEEIGNPLEGIEREWGWRCSKCKVVLPDDFDAPDNPPGMRFCVWCGAPMTDEAVEIRRKELEVVENG